MLQLRYIIEDIESMRKQFPKIEQGLFDKLIQLDPTYQGGKKQGDYTKWMLQLANKNALSDDDIEELPAILAQFKAHRNRMQNKDLLRYKSVQELADALAEVVDDDSMLSDRQKVRFHKAQKAGKVVTSARDDYDVVLETPKFIVYVPHTHEASMYLGKDTEWCTAHENPDWYNSYTENGHKLYIIKEKSTGNKWQYSDKNGDFLDQKDSKFDIAELLDKDERLSDFITELTGLQTEVIYDGEDCLDDDVFESGAQYIQKIIIEDGVDEIPTYAFYKLTSLKTVIFPDSVKEICKGAFSDCDSLEHIDIPNGVKIIGVEAFSGCSSLKNITIPNSVTEIGAAAFYFCVSLISVEIPNGIKKIHSSTFNHCKALKSVIIPDSVTKIQQDAFSDCPNITVYTDNDYAILFCEMCGIEHKPISEKKEALQRQFKLRIRE